MNKTIKVRTNTAPKNLAGSIMHTLDAGDVPVLSAIGAGATSTAVKSCAVAVVVFAAQDRELVMIPEFVTTEQDGKDMTIMNITVKELK